MVPLGVSATISGARPNRFIALLARHQVPGAQLAVYRGDELATIAAGTLEDSTLEDSTRTAVTEDAAFPLGSITKAFTATLAMVLVADGDLELQAPVREYLPELGDDPAGQLTLTHLLSHTSGLPCDPPAEADQTIGLSRYTATYCRQENMICEPGSAFSYSNVGYVVVGRMIEAVTGMGWREAMESILLGPLGIDPAFVCFDQPTNRPIATGHAGNPASGRLRPVEQTLDPAAAPTGALAASALDLVTLGRLHLDDGRPDLLPASFSALMRRPVPYADPFGVADGWGLGLATYQGSMVGHDGNAQGTACYLRVDPSQDLVVALTSNATTGYQLWQDVLGLLAQDGIEAGPAAVDLPRRIEQPPLVTPALGDRDSTVRHDDHQAELDHLPAASVGRYANGAVSYVVSADHDDQLRLTVDEEVSAQLTVGPELAFSLIDPESNTAVSGGRFVPGETTGEIDAIQVGGRLAVRIGRPASQNSQKPARTSA